MNGFRSLLRATRLAVPILLAASACTGGKALSVRSITQATLDSLPLDTVATGRLLCTADGRSSCPLHMAVANWLGRDRFVVWQPGAPVQLWSGNDTVPLALGATAGANGQPIFALAAGPDGRRIAIVARDPRLRLVTFDERGAVVSSRPLTEASEFAVRGMIGAQAVRQGVRFNTAGDSASFVVQRLSAIDDTTGTVILTVPLPWLPVHNHDIDLTTFFPPWPVYTLTGEGTLIWSPAARLELHAIGRTGREEWAITSDITGPKVTSADSAAMVARLLDPSSPSGLTPAQVDTMASRTGPVEPAVSGIIASPSGDLLVGGATQPSADSVVYYRLHRDGTPYARFRLGRRTTPLLLSGDSLLVHQPTEGEPWELRWLHLVAVR